MITFNSLNCNGLSVNFTKYLNKTYIYNGVAYNSKLSCRLNDE